MPLEVHRSAQTVICRRRRAFRYNAAFPQHSIKEPNHGTSSRPHRRNRSPEAAKPRVEAVLKANGFIPNLIGAVLANAPEALAFYQEVGKLNAANSLTGEVEVVQIIAAKPTNAVFCVAGHTKIATLKKLLSEKPSKPRAI